MNGSFKEEHWQAAVKEIKTLEAMDAWEVVDQDKAPNVIGCIWAFKLRQFPDGMVKKFIRPGFVLVETSSIYVSKNTGVFRNLYHDH
jgi:hypothetical protein